MASAVGHSLILKGKCSSTRRLEKTSLIRPASWAGGTRTRAKAPSWVQISMQGSVMSQSYLSLQIFHWANADPNSGYTLVIVVVVSGVSPRIVTKRRQQFLICPGCLGFYHESVKHYIRGDWDGNLGGWRGRRDIGGDWRIFPSEIGRSVYTILLAS